MLFEGVDLALEPKIRACLVGRNGAGKSTLIRILTGEIEVDGGERFVSPGARVIRVSQEPEIVGETLLDYAASGGGPAHDAASELQGFGLDPRRTTQGLSGGEARRAALARAFAADADVLLLDEPTNHLDILAIEYLEQRIRQSRAAILVVSHDRAFLERTTRVSFWLESRKVRRLDKGFKDFDAWSEHIASEEAEIARRLEKAIERETYTFYRSITAQRTRNEGRARALVAMRAERAQMLRDQPRQLEMAVDSGAMSGKIVAEAKRISKSFGDKTVLRDFSTRIVRGDRVAIVGPNGAGKTTLVKLLLGIVEPDSGTLRIGKGLQIAYLDQSRDSLTPETTLWDALADSGADQIMVRGAPRHVAGYAKDFLFQDKQLRQPVGSLSGGERNRLVLARALAKPANLLVLDEPTNDLDMDTLDLLEDLLADYDGTLILVSHDRDFIDRLATSTIALDGAGRVVETPGGWSDFLDQNPGFFTSVAATIMTPPKKTAPAAPRPAAEPAKLSFKDQHRLKELDALMPRLADQIAKTEAALHDPNLYARDPKAFEATSKTLDKARADLAAAEDEWLALEERRGALANARG
jgi:ATP-binding cassette subfamily F protein uup